MEVPKNIMPIVKRLKKGKMKCKFLDLKDL